MDDELKALQERVAALEALVRDGLQLTARTYERLEDLPRRLSEARADPAYEAAFAGDPLVSVRIGTYRNPDALIERALASARRQTYPHWEAVVVGDHCEDDTEARVAALGDERIRFYNRPFNGPYPPSRVSAGSSPARRRSTMPSRAPAAPGSPRSTRTTSGTTTTSRSCCARRSASAPRWSTERCAP